VRATNAAAFLDHIALEPLSAAAAALLRGIALRAGCDAAAAAALRAAFRLPRDLPDGAAAGLPQGFPGAVLLLYPHAPARRAVHATPDKASSAAAARQPPATSAWPHAHDQARPPPSLPACSPAHAAILSWITFSTGPSRRAR
jgi:hypothetical protein